jgi:hypothetical protein
VLKKVHLGLVSINTAQGKMVGKIPVTHSPLTHRTFELLPIHFPHGHPHKKIHIQTLLKNSSPSNFRNLKNLLLTFFSLQKQRLSTIKKVEKLF